MLLLYYVFKEGKTEEVIGHVSRVEHESSIGAALLRRCQGDFAVLHDLITPIHLAHNTYSLCGVGFLHHLQIWAK